MHYQKLLLLFQALPKAKQNRTVMQVSGYPHYENVCSNILAFFFDPEEEHGLNDLLLQSLFKVIHQSQYARTDNKEVSSLELPSFKTVNIEREYSTDGNKRIDLVITGDDFIIGIENKIYHWLANDLNHYAKALKQRAAEEQEKNENDTSFVILKTVLGLQPITSDKLHGGFASITYTDLWKEVQQVLGLYLPDASQKWVTYLLDFIETTKQLTGQNMELKKNDQFFIEHDEEIKSLNHERNDFLKRLNRKVADLFRMLSDEDAISLLIEKPWVYQKSCIAMDFYLSEKYRLAFDLVIYPNGWELQLLGRNKTSRDYMQSIIKQSTTQQRASEITPKGDRVILQTWTIHEELNVILRDLLDWIRTLPNAAKSLNIKN